MTDDYFERLTPSTAQRILGSDFDPNFSYTLITLPEKFVINAKHKESGDEKEFVLESDLLEEYDSNSQIVHPKRKQFKLHLNIRALLRGIFYTTVFIILFLGAYIIYLVYNGSLFDVLSKVVDIVAKLFR